MGKSRVIGLDIGTTHVRAAELKVSKGGTRDRHRPDLVAFGEVELPMGAVRDGEVAERIAVASALRQLWREHRFSSRDVVIGVGNQRVLVRDLELPSMPMAQLRASLPFQVQDMLPVAVEDTVLDYFPTGQVVGESGPMVTGLLVAATKDTVQANVAAVESAGLHPRVVDLNGFALARACANAQFADATVALVDIGARMTNIVIIARGVPRLVRTLPAGGQDVTDAIAEATKVTTAQAEQIKRAVGVGFAVAPDLALAAESAIGAARLMVEAVRNTLAYYASNNPGHASEVLIMTGGGSYLAGLGQYFSTATRLPVQVGAPVSALNDGAAAKSALADGREASLSVVLGLAMGRAA